MSPSHFFDRVEDHLLAMLFAHLPGHEVARLATVCLRWKEVVQGDGSDENIWKLLLDRDFSPYTRDSPAATSWTGAPSARLLYARMAAVENLVNPEWKQIYPVNGSRTVLDRQGAAGDVINGCAVVYGGWTSGILRTQGSFDRSRALSVEYRVFMIAYGTVSCGLRYCRHRVDLIECKARVIKHRSLWIKYST